ncbi:hypothetical protein V0288_24875 [Pannus brasiliensis CCIBt3594]|uniref:Uncharacterized protein n=1 Tax=Pannus brasiliensis CCIBt3594 TaxID=1427578 RepID=A0AAW9QMX2_9CHRO
MATITSQQRTIWLPSDVLTLEQETYRNLLALWEMFGDVTFAANVDDRNAPIINMAPGRAYDKKYYNVFTAAFELDEEIVTTNVNNKKQWIAALPWGQGDKTIPSGYFLASPTAA